MPPKQVQQADPLQFMLLDAADQALIDAGYDKKEFDRTRVGVLVGTEFGGDFSLAVGAWPAVAAHGADSQAVVRQAWRCAGRRRPRSRRDSATSLLKHWPALVDESGSFSTSTLASRITKTMNLMGGAAAIDSRRHFGRRGAGHERRSAAVGRLRHDDCAPPGSAA